MKINLKLIVIIVFILGLTILFAGCGGSYSPPVWQSGSVIPTTGPETADSQRIDTQMMELMKKYNLPGMSLAITKNGRLVLARGYGFADRELQQQMQPDTRGRLGSIGKTLTAMALLHLAEEGKLDLDTPFLNILTQYQLSVNGDPRILSVTVRQVMHHTAGWDTSVSGDPEMMSSEIAKALGVPEPTNCGDWIRYKLGKPLDFAPGTKYSYSNFGYCVLSRVLEKISGKNYYDAVREIVLKPMGIPDVAMGYTLESQRLPREVKYYDYPGGRWIRSLLPPHDLTPAPYGWAQIEALEGMGGWIGSAPDLTRFINNVGGSRGQQFLTAGMMQQFLERPPIPGSEKYASWYGLGIVVTPMPDGLYWEHNGGCPGTIAIVTHRPDGHDWAMILNSRPKDQVTAFNEIVSVTDNLITAGISDSGADLYDQFPSIP